MNENDLILITFGERLYIRYNRDVDRLYCIDGAVYLEKTRRNNGRNTTFILGEYDVNHDAEDMILLINEMPPGSIAAKMADPRDFNDLQFLRRMASRIRQLNENRMEG